MTARNISASWPLGCSPAFAGCAWCAVSVFGVDTFDRGSAPHFKQIIDMIESVLPGDIFGTQEVSARVPASTTLTTKSEDDLFAEYWIDHELWSARWEEILEVTNRGLDVWSYYFNADLRANRHIALHLEAANAETTLLSLSFCRANREYILSDYGRIINHESALDFVGRVFRLNPFEALDIIAQDLGLDEYASLAA